MQLHFITWTFNDVLIFSWNILTPDKQDKVVWLPPNCQHLISSRRCLQPPSVLPRPPPVHFAPPPGPFHADMLKVPPRSTVEPPMIRQSVWDFLCVRIGPFYFQYFQTWFSDEKSDSMSAESSVRAALCLWTSSSELTSDNPARRLLSQNKLSWRVSISSWISYKQITSDNKKISFHKTLGENNNLRICKNDLHSCIHLLLTVRVARLSQ